MTSTSTRDLYRRWLDELWAGQPGAAAQLVGPDFVGHWPDRDVHGPDGLAAVVAETRSLFTEITFELTVGPIVDGDLVAARWSGRGVTPRGSTSFAGNDVLRVAGGRFVEYWPASSAGS
ncbi:ester cyclase [Geodermatophilus sp. DSM 44513]|uniref:ester cyclase n=1 Tax=Geodermatophilus sp. DSM 44513 TaxID=1528104 RepID=UPI00126D43BE|nr:nuclear transport factor 2 family protein [Geodermatophilus sp. DSM 44513]WNV73855.1 nuclear transport factor 2 family protein [Geodermatophilus sp. DSM 44513]